jgi:DNA-binding MarR family transcriptional regulator
MILTPKNWKSFQHYKDRAPAWIKLHKGLLDDFTYARLPLASRALAPMLWLLASEYEDGGITASLEEIAFRLHISEADLSSALNPLIDAGFFVASEALAEPERKAILEKEDIGKRREETDSDANAPEAEKLARKKVSRPLPDGYSIPEAVQSHAAGLGLSAAEIAREHTKFCNHAKQTDRRCAEWGPAEETWMIGAAERLGKSPPSSETAPPDWNVVIELYKRTGHWSRWAGPDPESPACQAPRNLLAKYGLRTMQ